MQQIVSKGLKLDLHIHSCVSSAKDGAKVKNNTVKNIPLLIQRLTEQVVNMCAITDHDTFSYEMYSQLKRAESDHNSIQKVLPGVEFSVCFESDGRESVIHVVTIFSDEDDSKVQNVEDIIKNNPPTYKQAYKEADFLALLRKIEINTILIAHQKNNLSSQKPRKHDANILGNTKFLEFIYTDYFEAFEFKNRRSEVINKNYLIQHDLEGQLRFVTGTDCHDWSVYPSETPAEIIDDFPYTYAKCLPTFRGLVMAITDHSRLKTVDSFFTATKYTLPSINLVHSGETISVPLSKGINVIIGDNSIGKSMLLHAITGYTKPNELLPNAVKKGYKKYLQEMGLTVGQQITPEKIFCFDMQGEVRTKFEENKLNATDFLGQYFPKAIDNAAYKSLLEAEITKMISYLERKFEFDKKLKSLSPFKNVINDDDAESITFINNIGRGKQKSEQFSDIALQIENVITQIDLLLKKGVDETDISSIRLMSDSLAKMKAKYDERARYIDAENGRMETVSAIIKKRSDKHRRSISDSQKRRSEFTENTVDLKNRMIDLIKARRAIGTYCPAISSTKIRAKVTKYLIMSLFPAFKLKR